MKSVKYVGKDDNMNFNIHYHVIVILSFFVGIGIELGRRVVDLII